MKALTEQQLLYLLLAVVLVLTIGRGTAEIARRFRQPEVLGELIGGVILGPSALGALAPGAYQTIFLDSTVSQGLSLLSWIGAILLLLIAGLEVDLDIMRKEVRPGGFAAALAIGSSIVAGALYATNVLRLDAPGSYFLGIVLSVTAVSVTAKILMERNSLRRRYAQVILAAGIASEVLVWLMIAVVSSIRGGSPALAGLRTAVLAVAFFLLMMTVGRRVTFWAMRKIVDVTQIVRGQLTVVLVFTLLSAAATEYLGLHALLGAFVFGVLLSRAPRADLPLKDSLQSLVVSFFAPIFFVLAGMRVDIFKLGGASVIEPIVILLVVASVAKIGLGTLGGIAGGLGRWEALLVGVGVNLKGGTDVIVAILGAELGLISDGIYAMYAVVGILTVLFSPPLLAWLEARVPPSQEEMERLDHEEAARRAYMTNVEHVLVPMEPALLPDVAAGIVRAMAQAKHDLGEIFDLTQIQVEATTPVEALPAVSEAERRIQDAGTLPEVDVSQRSMPEGDLPGAIQAATREHVLVAIGAHRPEPRQILSFGEAQDDLLANARGDVLIAIDSLAVEPGVPRRILVPVNGMEYSYAAADVAGLLAKASGAEVTLLNVVHSQLDPLFWRENDQERLLEAGYTVVNEARFRLQRLDVSVQTRVDPRLSTADAILRELRRHRYGLIVVGAVNHGGQKGPVLGSSVVEVIGKSRLPIVLLVTREAAASVAVTTAAA